MPSQKKVLVIEDDAELSALMAKLLEAENCDVITAWNGEAGLANAKDLPDLIFLDINIEGKDGLKVLEEIRKDSKMDDIPVVMCSSANFPANKAKARDLGADGFLSKPFKIDDFTALAHRLLGTRAA